MVVLSWICNQAEVDEEKECKQGKEKNENENAQAPSTKARARPVTGDSVIPFDRNNTDATKPNSEEEWERTVGKLPGGGAFIMRYQYHVHEGIPWNCFFSVFFSSSPSVPTPYLRLDL